jgi:SpoVK/Ycf46/Vps4 family AAA+-type ATPase
MPADNDTLGALREAIKVSPGNVPLRRHVAELLLDLGRLDEAEGEFRLALSHAPDDRETLLGLARCFHLQGKTSQALVIVEDLVRHPGAGARACLLLARLYCRAGDTPQARAAYEKAVTDNPGLADAELAGEIGYLPGQKPAEAETADGRVRLASDSEPGAPPDIEVERPRINFSDVGGMDKVKDEIRMKIIHPLEHPEIYRAYGKPVGGGILMYGPPGCGKTHLARATAGEVKAAFISVGINDVLDMWLGNSERNLHELFEQARRNRPCVLFFDEVDALGASRSDLRQSAGRQLVNLFLMEMDGEKSSNDGVLILAATNAPWGLDPAFRRPGRFDRIVFVPPPDEPARAAILRVQLKGKPAADVDFDKVAAKARDFSGADLKAVVDVAIEEKLREAMKRGVPEPLTTRDLLAATRGLKPTSREWFSTARNYALYSNQGGFYDDVMDFLKLKG